MYGRIRVLVLFAFLVTGLAGCDEGGVTGPGVVNEGIVSQLVVDEDLTESIVTDAEASLAAVLGAPSGSAVSGGAALLAEPDPTKVDEARELLRQAREKFAQAREALQAGDEEAALALAEEGRRLVAEALLLVYGEEAVARGMERIDNMIAWLEERVDESSSELLPRIRELRDEAQTRWDDGDLVGAMERLLLARQIAKRERTHQRREAMSQHARLAIFMGANAVDLAVELVGENATDRQIHALRHAQHALVHAGEAFEAGRFRVAFNLGRDAVNLSLVAVIHDPDVSEDGRVAAMVELSERAIAAAEEALGGTDRDTFAGRLLELAKNLQSRGLEIVEARPRRAVQLLWHASTLAYGVVQLVS